MKIRLWKDCKVVAIIDLAESGDGYTVSAAGGAGAICRPQVEYDPWAGYLVDHRRAPDDVIVIEPIEDAPCSTSENHLPCEATYVHLAHSWSAGNMTAWCEGIRPSSLFFDDETASLPAVPNEGVQQ